MTIFKPGARVRVARQKSYRPGDDGIVLEGANLTTMVQFDDGERNEYYTGSLEHVRDRPESEGVA